MAVCPSREIIPAPRAFSYAAPACCFSALPVMARASLGNMPDRTVPSQVLVPCPQQVRGCSCAVACLNGAFLRNRSSEPAPASVGLRLLGRSSGLPQAACGHGQNAASARVAEPGRRNAGKPFCWQGPPGSEGARTGPARCLSPGARPPGSPWQRPLTAEARRRRARALRRAGALPVPLSLLAFPPGRHGDRCRASCRPAGGRRR